MEFGPILMYSVGVKMNGIWFEFNVKCISKEWNLI